MQLLDVKLPNNTYQSNKAIFHEGQVWSAHAGLLFVWDKFVGKLEHLGIPNNWDHENKNTFQFI